MIHINAARRAIGHRWVMMESLRWLGGLCTSGSALQDGMLVGLFAAGAAGSVVHCGPMCGGFILGRVSERMVRLPIERLCESQRIGNGLLLPYHLGRLTTYAGLGALAAGSAAVVGQRPWFRDFSAALLAVAALLFLAQAARRFLPAMGVIDRAPRFWGKRIAAVTRRIPRGSLFGEYVLGGALGFLPCGFLYAAMAAAASSARPAMGAASMLAFGLGTAPILMMIGVAGHAAGRRWNHAVTQAGPVLMVLNAILLLMLAWQRLT